ncbi:MAG: hypothetical protein RL563_2280 [Pseudomonadota bacterium]|jgi:MurNAc alpha-1-phosphate uridylyltransferase
MKALIFAAGRGERMRPLTDKLPKPLLEVGGKALIEYALENLANAGFKEVVINLAYLGKQIQGFCGDGTRWDVSIRYSDEGESALETAGGIVKALPLLGKAPFLAVNSDILCNYPLATLRTKTILGAHLVMIKNPPHHPNGDFAVDEGGFLCEDGASKLTFSGIGVYHPDLFYGIPPEPLKLRPILEQAIQNRRVSAEAFNGYWADIGTPERLAEINDALQKSQLLSQN